MLKITAKDEGRESCPLCREAIGGAAATTCPGCQTDYHGECLLEFGGTCVTLGCRQELPGYEAAPLDLPLRDPEPPTRADPALDPEPDPPAPRTQARPWRWPPASVWIFTGLIWFGPTCLYRGSTSEVFFDLSFWIEVLTFALPVWVAAALVTPMVLHVPRRW